MIKRMEITGVAAKYSEVKGKPHRFYETKDGILVPRDSTYPLSGPRDITKSAAKEKLNEVCRGGTQVSDPGRLESENQDPGGGGKK